MTAGREFGGAIALCAAGAGLVLLAARQGWARAYFTAPAPLPSGSVPVSGQELVPALSALALAALACLAAIIATRGLVRRLSGLALCGLGAWMAVLAGQAVRAAAVAAAVAGQSGLAGTAGSGSGGNSAISGKPTGGALPGIGTLTRIGLAGVPWRQAAIIGAAAVIMAGLLAAWRGPGWAVMSARFERGAAARRSGQPAAPASASPPGLMQGPAEPLTAESRTAAGAPVTGDESAGSAGDGEAAADGPGGPAADAAFLWEALDNGMDPTGAAQEKVNAPGPGDGGREPGGHAAR